MTEYPVNDKSVEENINLDLLKMFRCIQSIILLMLLLLIIINALAVNSFVFAQKEEDHMSNESREGDYYAPNISSITEWTGVFALGVTIASVMTLPKGKHDNFMDVENRVLVSIVVLSSSAGLIHILLIQEHAQESALWGLFFLITGIAQVIFAVIFVLILQKRLSFLSKSALCYVGIIGNVLLVGIFVFARLTVPPFSPEESPVNEMEPNGIITIIIEAFTIILLLYTTKLTSKSQRGKKLIQ